MTTTNSRTATIFFQSMKTCSKCGETKSIDGFYTNPLGLRGMHSQCKSCQKARGLAWWAANRDEINKKARERMAAKRKAAGVFPRKKAGPDEIAARARRRILGADGVSIFEGQGRRCACCAVALAYSKGSATPGDLLGCLDHCHDSGVIRGWLCANCNSAMGMLRDDPRIARNAAEYLERWSLFK